MAESYDQVMRKLQAAGTAQNRKVYARHGVDREMFGVSFGELGKLKKKIKQDHELGLMLWDSGNHDARILATMIVDPHKLTSKQLDSWARDLDNDVVTDAFAKVVAQSRFGRRKMETWTKRKGEWISSAGWIVLAQLAMSNDDEELTDNDFLAFLAIIEQTIHDRPNRTRYTMNNALIAIGIRNSKLQKRAVAAAKKIGPVEVDHGETSCKTPDAAAYIAKTVAHHKAKARRKKA